MKTTRELTIARYRTHLGRSPEMTAHIVRSLERCSADWPPADRNAPILDAGCGAGNLLAFLRAKGYANLEEVARFARVEIRPHWCATSWRGRAREICLRLLHRAVYGVEGRNAPRIASKNLQARSTAAE